MTNSGNLHSANTKRLLVLIVFFVGMITITAITVLVGLITRERGAFVIQTFGVIATLLLVLVYIHQLGENKRLHERDRERNVAGIILDDILRPTIETISHNKDTVRRDRIKYAGSLLVRSPTERGYENGFLYLLTRRADAEPGFLSLLSEHYPDIHEQLNEHDELLYELSEAVDQVQTATINDPDFRDAVSIYPELPREQYFDSILNIYLNDNIGMEKTDLTKFYSKHVSEIEYAIETHATEELEDFRDAMREYESHLRYLRTELIGLKGELRSEHGV